MKARKLNIKEIMKILNSYSKMGIEYVNLEVVRVDLVKFQPYTEEVKIEEKDTII